MTHTTIALPLALTAVMLWPTAFAADGLTSTEQVVVMPSASVLLPPNDRPWMAADYEANASVLLHFPPDKLPNSWQNHPYYFYAW